MKTSRAIKEFLRFCKTAKGFSPHTLRNYTHYLSVFEDWLNANGIEKIEDLSSEDVLEFQISLQEDSPEKTRNQKTLNYYLIAVRSLLKYLLGRDLAVLPPEKITLAKVPERQIHFLEPEEMETLLNAGSETGLNALRDQAVMQVLYSSGLRVSELVALKIAQINLERGEFSVRGKGGKVRPVFLSDEAQSALTQYLNARHDGNPSAFIRHFKNPKLDDKQKLPLTIRSIQRILRQRARLAGVVKPVTPHKMRHSFATTLLRNGADLRSVQALLGHSSVTTTQIYTHVTDKGLKEIHQRFHTKDGPKKNDKTD